MNAVGDHTAGLGVELEVDERQKIALTVEYRLNKSTDRAALVQILFTAKLHPRIELKREIGMLGDNVAGAGGGLRWLVFGIERKRWRLLSRGECGCRDLPPDGLDDRAHVLLKGSRA